MSQAPNSGKKIQNYVFSYSDFLGKGNFSKCYKATHIKTQQVVAIKIVELNSLKSKKLQQLLFSQIAILKELNHPNVLKCLEVFTSNRNCYIITEHCNEGDLQTKVKKKGALQPNQIHKVLADVYNGLCYLASKGIIHRDLKISNVFLQDGRAKIADFGFALHCNGNFQDLNIGSPLYMSPQGFLKNTYGPKTDVWSFGIMVYELYHKRTPFCGCRTEKDLKAAIMTPLKNDSFKESVPQQVKQLIFGCLQIQEQKRPLMGDLKRYAYIQQIMQMDSCSSQSMHIRSPQKVQTSLNPFTIETAENRTNQSINSYRSAERSRTMDRYASPSKIIFNGPIFMTNSKDLSSNRNQSYNNQSLNHHNMNNSPTYKFQSPQVKKGSGYPLESSNNVNNSLNFTPISQRQLIYPSDRFAMTQPLAVHLENQRKKPLINCQLNFKQSVSIIHYCRLIFKYLQLYKEVTQFRQNYQKRHYAFLGNFLLLVLDQMHREVVNKKIKYQGNNPEMRSKKLNQVNEQYRRKYAEELDRPILKQYISEEDRNHMTFNHLREKIQSAISNSMIPENCTNKEAIVGQLLLTIYSSTILMEESSNRNNYQLFQKNKDIENILNRDTNHFNYTSYTRHKNQIFNLDNMIAV